MVLESLINPFKAEKKPWEMFFLGFVYNTIAIILSLIIFKGHLRTHISLLMVFLTSLACVPLIYNTIKREEKYDIKEKKESKLLKEHARVLYFLMFLFLGITISVAFWYVLLPLLSKITFLSTNFPSFFSSATHNSLFNIQAESIKTINAQVTANAVSGSGAFWSIFTNNMWVLFFCLLFSFFYGAGAIFILTWNASVVGVAIGKLLTPNLTLGFLRYFVHGPIEIAAYFIAGLAGGIISIAVINHDYRTKKFEHVLLDSVDLILIAILLLVIAAFVEVFITPILF